MPEVYKIVYLQHDNSTTNYSINFFTNHFKLNQMTTEQKAHKYELLKISIETLLKAYKETLIDQESGLKDYQNLGWEAMEQLKKEKVAEYKGMVEVLTYLNK